MCSDVFLKTFRNGHFPSRCMKMTISTYLCQHWVRWHFVPALSVWWCLIALICISLTEKEIAFFFINWLVFIFYDCSFNFFACFSFELFFLFWDLYIWNNSSLLYILQILSVSYIFIFYSYLFSNRNFQFYVVIFVRFLFLYNSFCVLV